MAGPHPAVASARNAVAALDLPAGARVIAGVSGGADSLTLAAALAFVAPRQGWAALAVIVDHGLREESARDAAHAAAICRDLGLDTEVVRARVTDGPDGPEGEARKARMAALLERAADGHVLLGHTLDDQAETVLLGLARGSGTRSLAGMAPVQGRVLRPLLGLGRADTEAVCEALGLTPIEDPSNALDGPWRRADGGPLLRSAVRHIVLPVMERELGPKIAQALSRTAALARADADALDEIARAVFERSQRDGALMPHSPVERSEQGERSRNRSTGESVASHGFGSDIRPPRNQREDEHESEAAEQNEVRIDVGLLDGLHTAVRTRVLNRAIIEAGGNELSAVHTWTVERLVTEYHGQGAADLPGFVKAEREGRDLVIRRSR